MPVIKSGSPENESKQFIAGRQVEPLFTFSQANGALSSKLAS